MYSFIDNHRGLYSVGMMARVLKISPRSYYDFKRGIYGLRERNREVLEYLIQQVYASSKGRYGSPRIAAGITASGYQHGCQVYETYGIAQQVVLSSQSKAFL